MPVARLALAGAFAVAALTLAGCGQEESANDNTNPRPQNQPVAEPTIIRTPVQVDEAPATVPLPGVTGGPVGEPAEGQTTFSPGPDGEGEQAESSQQGPTG